MQLLIDVGNTRLKWRWLSQGQLLPGGWEPLPRLGEEDAVFSRLWGAATVPERLVVSNVAGDGIRQALEEWSLRGWGRPPEFLVARAEQAGVVNGYREPSALGADRWCALIGARSLVRGPLAVVCCGTAVTVDLLDADGRHEGGVIGPGLSTMIQALTDATRGVRMETRFDDGFAAPLGRSTVECVQAGVVAAAAGMVEGTLERAAFPASGVVVITGGDAERVGAALRRSAQWEPDLIFHGLARIAGGIG